MHHRRTLHSQLEQAAAVQSGKSASMDEQMLRLRTDAGKVQEEVARLREENDRVRAHAATIEAQASAAIASATAAAAAAAASSSNNNSNSNYGGYGAEQAIKDTIMLKQIVSKLETDLLTERTKHQRAIQKRTKQIETLQSELSAVKDSERTLQIR